MACRGLHHAATPFRPLKELENRLAARLVRTAGVSFRLARVGCICRRPWDCAGTRGARCGTARRLSLRRRSPVRPSHAALCHVPARDGGAGGTRPGRRHCYLLPRADRVTMSWSRAAYLGRRVGAALQPRRFVHLLTITSAAEGRRVRDWLPPAAQLVWLGLRGRGIDSWRWQSGEPLNYTAWARRGLLQEPNGRNETDNCATWANFAAAGYGWADIACNGRYHAYPAFEFEY
ncbi:hypothetical protein FJT64_014651 [Amphibalanus amphitrite]|uniref:C-type lectin domain-containing protein n=1 Tax=Amphibalanus amphitrite TaxID=1232801 RepID=A0A6A4UT69_AMPAM|nr:hypothetical protein FJT64_014651 [Amphibalanus amphitrite]